MGMLKKKKKGIVVIDLSRPRVKFMLIYRCQKGTDPVIKVPEGSP